MEKIPVYAPFLNGNEKKYVNNCVESTWISSKGEYIRRFEESFGQYIGTKYATSVCNGTVALHLALESLGLGAGDEVIVPTLTYIASVNTIVQTGATPVFVDSLQETWQIDPEDVRRKITARTRAVMVVHLYGQPCEMEAIVDVCRENDLYLVEDCAEAFGSFYKGKHAGTFGDIATFSFFGNKTITTGEGGMVVSGNAALHERCAHLKSQGVSATREYWHDMIAFNYRMTNIAASIGLAQLEQADGILERKRAIAEQYANMLDGLPLLTHKEASGTRHSFWMCSILVDDAGHRDPLRTALGNAGIETRPLFVPAHQMPAYFRPGENFPVAQYLSVRGINLPSSPLLGEQDVSRICDEIRGFFGKAKC